MGKILVTRSSMPPMEEYINEIASMWETHWLTNMGEKHIKLQSALTEYLKVPYVELLTNGHMALEMTLQAFDFPEGSEVITTPFTFASTTHAIVRNNLVPVFCDINEDDYTIDTQKIESLITDKTCAIMPVHVYGNICDVEAIKKIALKHNLKVIYDAAHAFGEEYEGAGVGDFGDASCFSFHATKVYNTIEGGAVCYHEPRMGKALYNLKNFGIKDEEHVIAVGANAKMNEFCAAMGICNLRHLPEEISKRQKVYERYVSRLKDAEGIKISQIKKQVKPNYAYFPVVIDEKIFGVDRNAVHKALGEKDIIARKYFYPLVNDFECYKDKYSSKDTPIAKWVSDRVITLPMYADLSLETVDTICDIILELKK